MRDGSGYRDASHLQKQLADAYYNRERYGEAIELYTACLQGAFSADSEILLDLARAHDGAGNTDDSIRYLDQLESEVGERMRAEGLILKARMLLKAGEVERASDYFERASRSGQGLEYRYWYGKHLMDCGSTITAYSVFQDMLDSYKMMPSFARRENRKWITLVEREMKTPSGCNAAVG